MKSKKILPLVLLLSTFALGSCGGNSSSPVKPSSSSPVQNNSTTPTPFVDTREFMLVGQGLGAEQKLTWTPTTTPATQVKFTQETGKNVYKLTVNLYQDDQFKVVSTKGWNDGQVRFAQLDKAGDNFEASGENIKVKVSAVYTLTLTTTSKDNLVLSYTKGADLVKPTMSTTYHLKGSWDEWTTLKDMVADASTPTLYTVEMTFAANDQFGIQVNNHLGETVTNGGFLDWTNVVEGTEGFEKSAKDNNIVCTTAGTYVVSLDTADGKKEISFTLKTSGGESGGENGGSGTTEGGETSGEQQGA